MFTERELPVTIFGCAVALERNPPIAEAGWARTVSLPLAATQPTRVDRSSSPSDVDRTRATGVAARIAPPPGVAPLAPWSRSDQEARP